MFECVYFVPQTQTKIVAVNKYFEKWRSGNMLLSRDLKRPHFLRITQKSFLLGCIMCIITIIACRSKVTYLLYNNTKQTLCTSLSHIILPSSPFSQCRVLTSVVAVMREMSRNRKELTVVCRGVGIRTRLCVCEVGTPLRVFCISQLSLNFNGFLSWLARGSTFHSASRKKS